MTVVTLTALFLGGALLVSARDEIEARAARPGLRFVALAAMVAATSFAFVGLVSATALATSADAVLADDWRKAEAQARKATRWAPWSAAGWRQLGDAQLQQGKLAEARSSFRRALEKDPRDWGLWLDLALASEGQARSEAARVALRLNPLSPQIAALRPYLGLPPAG
jgi:Flp pilus assembly protein TadD